jgi:hypothetical protein
MSIRIMNCESSSQGSRVAPPTLKWPVRHDSWRSHARVWRDQANYTPFLLHRHPAGTRPPNRCQFPTPPPRSTVICHITISVLRSHPAGDSLCAVVPLFVLFDRAVCLHCLHSSLVIVGISASHHQPTPRQSPHPAPSVRIWSSLVSARNAVFSLGRVT